MEQIPDISSALSAVSVQPEQGVRAAAVNPQQQPGNSFREALAVQKGLSERKLPQGEVEPGGLPGLLLTPLEQANPVTGQVVVPVLNPRLPAQLATGLDPSSAVDPAEGQELPPVETLPFVPQSGPTQDGEPKAVTVVASSTTVMARQARPVSAVDRHGSPGVQVPEPATTEPELNLKRSQPVLQTVVTQTLAVEPASNGLLVQAQATKFMSAKLEDDLFLSAGDELGKIAQTLGVKPGADKQLRSDAGTPLSRVVDQVGLYSEIGDSRYRQAEQAVKPSEAMVLKQDLDSPLWQREFANRIVWMTKNNMHTAKMRIDPPNLGSIEIKITVNHDQAAVSFVSNNATVRDAIESASARLREVFADNGFQSLDVDVSGKENHDRRPHELAMAPQNNTGTTVTEESPETEQHEPVQGVSSNLVVDYFV